MRISDYYNLGRTQIELDFVDVPVHTDIKLFLDPYAISKGSDELSVNAHNTIIGFFEALLRDIADGNEQAALAKLEHLREPNDTHLGSSTGEPDGRGVGEVQASRVYNNLVKSKAAKTGVIQDLSDCELLIEGIGPDKISDITTNLIREHLIKYTQQQCDFYGIPKRLIASGFIWDQQSEEWAEKFEELPVCNDGRLLLVPRALVRYRPTYNAEKFYRGFYLEFLQQEHLNMNSSLVSIVKGQHRVFKKTLMERPEYTHTKLRMQEFVIEHPEVLGDYVESLPDVIEPLTVGQIEDRQEDRKPLDYLNLRRNLDSIPPGRQGETEFHNHIIGILEAIFSPALFSPEKEEQIHDGRKRLDITYMNRDQVGFFNFLRLHHKCAKIVVECKNYSETNELGNPEIDQIAMRLNRRNMQVGIVVCRTIQDKETLIRRCRDVAVDEHGIVLPLCDEDLQELLKLKELGDDKTVMEYMTNLYRQIAH